MISVDSQGDITLSGSQMGSQLLQNTEIIKQTDVLLWKIWRKYRSVSYLFSCTLYGCTRCTTVPCAVHTIIHCEMYVFQNVDYFPRKPLLSCTPILMNFYSSWPRWSNALLTQKSRYTTQANYEGKTIFIWPPIA